jgi:ABC-2 type transport system ATP-binding protein
MTRDELIVFDNVSRFYGDVLGVNNVNLSIPPGITSLVGPNGAGKTTLMNLMTGLIRPTRGSVSVLGLKPEQPEELFRIVGYCTQFDSFPRGMTGFQFVQYFLRIHGFDDADSARRAWESIERVGMKEAANRRVGGYSKGMRQRIKLAQSLSHSPRVLVLDEPLNGLDPMARAETIALFEALGEQGVHVLVSSHILHEVDRISDQVILLSQGYVVAEGAIEGVRSEVKDHPIQVMVRCDNPQVVAARLFADPNTMEVTIHKDRKGLMVRTVDVDEMYLLLNSIVLDAGVEVESVAPADEDVNSVYQYLIGAEGATV